MCIIKTSSAYLNVVSKWICSNVDVQAVTVSDIEATELESMRVALTASRSDFNVQQSADFDQAVHESVELFEQQQQQVRRVCF